MLKPLARALTVVLLLTGCSAGPDQTSEDDRPTRAEYEAAQEATRKCLEERGFTLEIEEHDRQVIYGVDSTTEEGSVAFNECAAEHLDEIEAAYSDPGHLTGAERDAEMQRLLDCLADTGVHDLSSETTDSQVFLDRIGDGTLSDLGLSDALRCFNTHRGVWPPGDPNNP